MLKRVATFLLGVGLIGLGVFCFLSPEQAYLVQLLKRCWPLFLVLAGLVRLTGHLLDRHPRSPIGSLLLTALGGILFAVNVRGESSLTDIVGRYWFWFLLAYVLGRVLRQYTLPREFGKAPARALSPGGIFAMVLITAFGLGANYLSKHGELLSGVHLQVNGVGDYVFGNSIQIEDEAPQTIKLPPNAQLVLNGFNGNVEIRGAAVTEITAKLTKHIRATNAERAREAAKSIHLEIAVSEKAAQLSLTASQVNEPFTASLLLEVPSQNKLSVAITQPSGKVTIKQLSADLALNKLAQGAELSEIKGRVTLDAEGGSYEFKQITGTVHANVVNGRLAISGLQAPPNLPANERVLVFDELRDTRVNLAVITGNLFINASRSRIEAEALNGDAQINTSGEPVKLSRCTGALRVNVDNGAVTASDLKGSAQIEAARDITVQNFAGPLSVKTRTGKLTLTQNAVLRGNLTAVNEHGQTRLTLPHDIAFRLDASTMSGKLRARGFDGLELSRNQKTVTANFRADNKTPLVSLRSTSGNIELQSSGLALASNEE